MDINIDKFIEIEKKYGLYDDTIQGENYWVYTRFTLFNNDVMAKYLNMEVKRSEHRGIRAGEWLNLMIAFAKSRLQRRRAGASDVLFIIHPRRVLIDGAYQSIYTDILEDAFDESLSVEIVKPYLYVRNVKTRRLYYLFDGFLVFNLKAAYLRRSNSKRRAALCREIKDHIRLPFEEIQAAYGIDLDIDKWANDISIRIERIKHYKKTMKKLLDRQRPRVIVELVAYAPYNMALNEIARERGIPTIELQHGTMHADHAGYQYGTGVCIRQLPNEILTFSEYWNQIAHFPAESTRLVATGFPYLEKRMAAEQVERRDARTTILFVSQETIGAELSRLAVLLKGELSPRAYRLVYKLHPGECVGWKSQYPHLVDAGIEVIDNKDYGIYRLFAQSDIQVGVYSTALYEGLAFGLKTYIYNIGEANTMKPLADQGYAAFFDDAAQLRRLIERSGGAQDKAALFWKRDAYNNVVNEIKRAGGLK